MEIEPSEEQLLLNLLDPVVFIECFIKLESPEGMIDWVMDHYQKHLVRDQSRNRAINKSKKTGISTTIAGESIHKAITIPGRQLVFVSTGERIAKELLGKWYDLHATLPPAIRGRFLRHSAQLAVLPNNSRIMSLPSSNPGNIRGFGMRGPETDVYVDEYAHVSNDKELWIVVRDFQIIGGRITLNSTPKGKRGKFYEIVGPLQAVYRGELRPFKTLWSYHEIHFKDCPRLYLQEKFLHSGMTDIDFKQEYCAEFIDESLSFFPYDLIEGCNTPPIGVTSYVSTGYKTKNPIYFGIDLGKSVSETIVYIVEETAPEVYKTLWIEVMPGVNYDQQLLDIKALAHEFHPSMINLDASGPGGQTMYDFMNADPEFEGILEPYDLTTTFKEKIIIRLRVLMKRKKVGLPSKELGPEAENLERQLHGIQRTTTQSGMHTRYSGKETEGMDDMAWALALAVYKDFVIEFDPMIVVYQDKVLQQIENEMNVW